MTGWLWTAAEAAEATGGQVLGNWQGIGGITIDTREMAPGDLFVALVGDNRDGHAFVASALAAGAGAALVARVPEGVDAEAPLLLVDDTQAALEALGRAGRARTAARVIGVTGSVGKTSTKEMLRTMLAGQGRTHAAIRSFNNHWGVPLTLARMPQDCEFAVVEIGMNHPGEITPLSRMARPHVAMITTVEAVHMAAFTSVEQIADAKAEIFAGLEPGGVAVLNRDNPHFDRLAGAAGDATVVPFGQAAELWRLDAVTVGDRITDMAALLDGTATDVRLGAPGAHFAMNALGALACVAAVGGNVATAAAALATWSPPAGRGSRFRIDVPNGAVTLLDESYNANPASMHAALAVLAAAQGTRRTAFLGDMLELGPTETVLHAGLADASGLAEIDRVHTCGPLMQALHAALPVDKRGEHCADSQELAARVPKLVDAGDVVMVKGSLGAAMRHVTEALKSMGPVIPDDGDGRDRNT